jgi:bacteriorhodopsin
MTFLFLSYLAVACTLGCISLLASLGSDVKLNPWLFLLAHALWPISFPLVILTARWHARSHRP